MVEAVREQAGRLMHVSNLFYTEPMVRLAERLSESSLGGRVFFSNSGTEANECAIKIARKHAHGRGVAEPEIVSFERDFHGRTYGALAATPGAGAATRRWGRCCPASARSRATTPTALREAVGESTAAVLIEPIQGEAGVYPISDEALLAARQACDEAGALLIFDEIQTGMGRTGSLWAYEQTPVRPDVLTSAKALGGGLPIGACVTGPRRGRGARARRPRLDLRRRRRSPTAAALAVLDIVDDPALLRGVRELGALAARGLAGARRGRARSRGRGLMVGVGLERGDRRRRRSAPTCSSAAWSSTFPSPATLRLLPPLMVDSAQIERAVGLIGESLLGCRAERERARTAQRRRRQRARPPTPPSAWRDRRGRRARRASVIDDAEKQAQRTSTRRRREADRIVAERCLRSS